MALTKASSAGSRLASLGGHCLFWRDMSTNLTKDDKSVNNNTSASNGRLPLAYMNSVVPPALGCILTGVFS